MKHNRKVNSRTQVMLPFLLWSPLCSVEICCIVVSSWLISCCTVAFEVAIEEDADAEVWQWLAMKCDEDAGAWLLLEIEFVEMNKKGGSRGRLHDEQMLKDEDYYEEMADFWSLHRFMNSEKDEDWFKRIQREGILVMGDGELVVQREWGNWRVRMVKMKLEGDSEYGFNGGGEDYGVRGIGGEEDWRWWWRVWSMREVVVLWKWRVKVEGEWWWRI